MSKKSRTILVIAIIVSIVVLVGAALWGSFYLWSRDCRGQVVPGPKSAIVTKC